MVKRCLCLLEIGILSLGLALMGALPVRAEEEKPDSDAPVLVFKPLRDAGGLAAPAKGETALNDQITTGLIRYLRERGSKRLNVVDTRERSGNKPASKQPTLTLEGDFSRMAGRIAEQDTYMLTARLFQEGAPRHIVAQWSGAARSLMYLTNNTKRDPRFSDSGLVGEIGGRILQTMSAFAATSTQEQQKRFAKLVLTMKTGPQLKARVTPVAPVQNVAAAPEFVVNAGSAYGIEVTSDAGGEVCLVSQVEGGDLAPLLVPPSGKEQAIKPKQPLLLPTEGQWKAPVVLKPTTMDVFVLVHEARLIPAPNAVLRPGPAVSEIDLTVARADKDVPRGLDAEPDVRVIDGGNRLLPLDSGDKEISRLLKQVEADGAQSWSLSRIKLKVLPPKTHKVSLVAIGINSYPHVPGANLEFARQDAEQIAAFWNAQGATALVLTEAQATRQAVTRAWNQALEKAGPGESVIFFWGGHAKLENDAMRLVPVDGDPGKMETLIPLAEIVQAVAKTNAANTLLLLDTQGSTLETLKRTVFDGLSGQKKAPSVGILAVAGTAYEDTSLKAGLLTSATLVVLKAHLQKNTEARFYDMAQEIQQEAKKMAAKLLGAKPDFTPIRVLYGEDFVVVP